MIHKSSASGSSRESKQSSKVNKAKQTLADQAWIISWRSRNRLGGRMVLAARSATVNNSVLNMRNAWMISLIWQSNSQIIASFNLHIQDSLVNKWRQKRKLLIISRLRKAMWREYLAKWVGAWSDLICALNMRSLQMTCAWLLIQSQSNTWGSLTITSLHSSQDMRVTVPGRWTRSTALTISYITFSTCKLREPL